MQIKKDY